MLPAVAREAALLLTFGTGLCALVYEVAWQRYLAHFLGSAAHATAIILAVFLGGLCGGYLLFGHLSRRRSPAWLVFVCGVSEVLIGLWALFFPGLFELVWQRIGVVDPRSTLSVFADLGVSILLIGVPTVLMGGTLPLLTQGLSQSLTDARRFHARVYASNTFGAFAGCLLGGFYFLPEWGLEQTMERIACLSLLAGGVLAALAILLPRGKGQLQAPQADEARPLEAGEEISGPGEASVPVASTVAFFAGFCSLCLQTVFIRLTGMTMGSSEYAFSMIVAVFVSMLAAGSWLVSKRDHCTGALARNQLLVFIGLFLLYPTVSAWPYLGYLVRLWFSSKPQAFYVYHFAMFLLLALLLVFPVGMMGATMPRIFSAVATTPAQLGTLVGRLYAWNTFGCVLGALLGGYWLLTFFDLDTIYRLCLGMVLAMSLLAAPATSGKRQKFAVRLTYVALLVGTLLLPDWNKAYLSSGLFRERRSYKESWLGPKTFFDSYFRESTLLFYRDGPNSTVSVVQQAATPIDEQINHGTPYVRSLVVNGKSDGLTAQSDSRTMRLVAHLPILLNPAPAKKVAVVGFGLGVSAGNAAIHREVERVDVAEIAPAVLWAAPFFDFANEKVTTNPKVHVTLGDGYRTLASSREQYSVIISEPSNPWVTGVERLFSVEFYRLVKQKLDRSGIYCQWFHQYAISRPTLELVLRTFSGEFPYIRLFRQGNDLILLGSFEPLGAHSVSELDRRLAENPEVVRSLAEVDVPNAAALLGLEQWYDPHQLPDGEVQTLQFPKLAFAAGKDFFMASSTTFDSVLRGDRERAWERAAGQRALVLQLLNRADHREPERRLATLTSYAKAACDLPVLEILPNWLEGRTPCVTSLASAALDGAVDLSRDEVLRATLQLVRTLQQGPGAIDTSVLSEFVADVPIPQIESAISAFQRFDSVFIPLSPQRLLAFAKRCIDGADPESAECRSRLIEALAVTGHPKEARTVLERHRRSSPSEEEVGFFEALIADSDAAFPASGNS